jgi:hypothetical protein
MATVRIPAKHQRTKKAPSALFFLLLLIAVFPGTEAIAAVHRTLACRLEGNLGLRSAFGAGGFKHRAVAPSLLLLRGTALGTSFWDILEALFLVEFLFGSGKDELTPTIRTRQRFVLKHFFSFLFSMVYKIEMTHNTG